MNPSPDNQNKESGASSKVDVGAILRKRPWLTALVAALIIGGIILLYIFLPVAANKARTQALIKIPANATPQMVEDSISKYLGDKYSSRVMTLAKMRNSNMHKRHGAFMIDSGMTPIAAERVLSVGRQHPVKVVINGARGTKIVAERIAGKLDFTPDSLVNHLKDAEYLASYGLKPDQALALFIDDTYEMFWNASPKGVTDKLGSHFNKVWNEQRREKAAKLGLTPGEVITLASIVDEETNKMDEKPKVARLYLNRLDQGMKLQADPTVKFALGDFSLRRIRNNHLEVESPYNTYKVTGLPPGPIRTVTVKDIDAVLDAPQHDYLYMCAKEDFSGYHNFAKDYSTHLQNARRYQKALNQRNIK